MKREWVIEQNGKSYVLYAGLLDLAHEKGLRGITVTVVQLPTELNGMTAVCSATAEMPDGSFSEVGDASPSNVTRMMAPHIIRMAATRAKARALRDAVNIGVTAFEELGGDGGDDPAPSRSPGVVSRGNARVDADLGRGNAAPRPAGPGPYAPGGAAGSPGPLEAPEWPAVPAGTPADGVIGPTDRQRAALHKFGIRDIPAGMTRKEASDLLDQKIKEAREREQGGR